MRGRRPTARALVQPNSYLYLCLKVIIYETEKRHFFLIQSVKRVDYTIDVGEWNGLNNSFSVGLCICVYYLNIEYSEANNECSAYVLNNNITSVVHSRNPLHFTRNKICSIYSTPVISRHGLLVSTAPKYVVTSCVEPST